MRVGANARQFARIKKMHKEGTPAPIIARTIQMTDQSLEKILAALDGREERILVVESSPEMNQMRIENAELAARLAKYEDPDSGEILTIDEASAQTTEEVETSEEVAAEEEE